MRLRLRPPSGLELPALIVASLVLAAGAKPVQADTLNEIVLRVNDRIATLYDYLDRRASMRDEILRSGRYAPEEQERLLAEAPKKVMRDLFQELLLESRADQMEIAIDPGEVDEEIRTMRERNGIATDAELEQALADAGLSIDRFRAQFESEMRMQRVVAEEVRSKVKVEEEDQRRFYRNNPDLFRVAERWSTREIVVLEDSGLGAAEREELARAIVARLRAGERLEAIAQEGQADGSTSGVIDLGWLGKGELDPSLEGALAGLANGAFTDPVPGRGGLHVVQLVERQEATVKPFAEVKDEILGRERSRRFNQEFDDYLRLLEERAHVVERVPTDAVGYRTSKTGGLREPFKILGEDTAPVADEAAPSPAAQAEAEAPAAGP